MKKNMIFILGLAAMFLPVKVNALEADINFSCGANKLKPGAETTCSISAKTEGEVAGVAIELVGGENLTISNIVTDSSWEGDGENGNIQLYTADNKTGNIPIATFKVKAANVNTGVTTSIGFKNNKATLTDKDFKENSFDVQPLSIRIPSTINTLSAITIDGTAVSGFAADKTSYNLTVDSSKTSVALAVVLSNEFAEVTGDIGVRTLKYGNNTFTYNVTSEIGDAKTYTVVINRPEVRELKSLKVNGTDINLKAGVYEYSYIVKNDVSSVDIKALLNNTELASFVEEFGDRKVEDLKVGNNEILIKVTDKDKQELVYKLIVNRLDKEGKDVTTPVVENPDTWNGIGYGILALVAIVSGTAYFVIRKRSKFPNKI